MAKWYENIYRRNLIDMHINDDRKIYLSRFSAENYFKYLKEANIKSPMIYLHSHAGLCNFPSKVAKTHAFFEKHPDEIKKLISLCQKDGMKVVGYYSLIFNNWAVDQNPDWEMIDKDGKTWRDHGQRYGLACPNNHDYRDFLKKQIKEVAEEYPNLDGIFFDMPYWEVLCHCPSCQEKYKKETGLEMPSVENWDDPNWLTFIKKRQEWMGEFTKFVKEETARLLPNTTIEFNFAAVVGCDFLAGSTELINDKCEFTGGDLYGDLYNHSFVAKYYRSISKHQPFEYMTCRCNKTLREHTISKNELTLESEIMLSTLLGGASLIIDAINPDGSLDHRVSKRLGKVFQKEMSYEKYLPFGEPYFEVALFFDSKTQYQYHHRIPNKQLVIQASKNLIEQHIPYTILAHTVLNNLQRYQMLLMPGLLSLNSEEIKTIKQYVLNGGTLYLSGDSNNQLLKEFFGGEIKGETFRGSSFPYINRGYQEIKAYVAPNRGDYKKIFGEFNKKYPLPSPHKLPLLNLKEGEMVANIVLPYTDPDNYTEFASIHSNPPGKATNEVGIAERVFGKGKVIYSALSIEGDNRYNYKDIFTSIIRNNINNTFKIETSPFVEAIIFKNGNDYIVHLYDLNFANEVISRDFSITLPFEQYQTYLLLNSKAKIKQTGSLIKGRFKKYVSLTIKNTTKKVPN